MRVLSLCIYPSIWIEVGFIEKQTLSIDFHIIKGPENIIFLCTVVLHQHIGSSQNVNNSASFFFYIIDICMCVVVFSPRIFSHQFVVAGAQLKKGDITYFCAPIRTYQHLNKNVSMCAVVCLYCKVPINQVRSKHTHTVRTKQISHIVQFFLNSIFFNFSFTLTFDY